MGGGFLREAVGARILVVPRGAALVMAVGGDEGGLFFGDIMGSCLKETARALKRVDVQKELGKLRRLRMRVCGERNAKFSWGKGTVFVGTERGRFRSEGSFWSEGSFRSEAKGQLR